jgi:hypothetical protein
MINDALWDVRYGIWFSGPYRLWRSPERGDWCAWYCAGVGRDGVLTTSVLLRRGFTAMAEARRAVESHRELMRVKIAEAPRAP